MQPDLIAALVREISNDVEVEPHLQSVDMLGFLIHTLNPPQTSFSSNNAENKKRKYAKRFWMWSMACSHHLYLLCLVDIVIKHQSSVNADGDSVSKKKDGSQQTAVFFLFCASRIEKQGTSLHPRGHKRHWGHDVWQTYFFKKMHLGLTSRSAHTHPSPSGKHLSLRVGR